METDTQSTTKFIAYLLLPMAQGRVFCSAFKL